ncbi:MAG: hypothetical protein JW814_01670 [Candidatus Krumholzibacteriota bacterium]|nr:hypothetical protein [Candidatus Krumholzibacteriota bacterium]
MSSVFIGIALVSLITGIVSAIVMAAYLSNRGHKVSILFFRLFIMKYIHQYSKITTAENGKPGFWFYLYIISMNLALVTAIVGLVLK